MHILLAEDDPNITIIMQLVLEKIGKHQVTVAADGAQALETALSGEFDLILLDGMMPKLSGLQVFKSLLEKKPDLPPVIFLSAKTDVEEINEFRKRGAGYIQKPFDPETICQRILDVMQALKTGAV